MHKADTHRALATLQATDAVYQLEGEPEQRHEVNELARLVKSIQTTVEELATRSPVAVDATALAAILAGDTTFVSNLGRAIAESLGEIPSARDTIEALANALLKGIEL
jgi:cell division protein ZapA (FtsZ GTPase activity inhibitor)